MEADLQQLLAGLDVRELEDGRLTADNFATEYWAVLGGQLMAQAVMALRRTAGPQALKSFTQRFLRAGRTVDPVVYTVADEHAGRTFATSEVRATQNDTLVSVMNACLHRPEPGLDLQTLAPTVPGPEGARATEFAGIPWEVRVVGDTNLQSRESAPPRLQLWMRAPHLASSADDRWIAQALLAHATHLTVIGTALLPIEGISQADTDSLLSTAVTAQSMWFHQPFRLDRWLLLDQTAPVLSEGRAFGRADVWTASGKLVASMAQESLVRPLLS